MEPQSTVDNYVDKRDAQSCEQFENSSLQALRKDGGGDVMESHKNNHTVNSDLTLPTDREPKSIPIFVNLNDEGGGANTTHEDAPLSSSQADMASNTIPVGDIPVPDHIPIADSDILKNAELSALSRNGGLNTGITGSGGVSMADLQGRPYNIMT